MSRIAILGAGNGGCAAAADLTLRGHSVALFEHPDLAHVLPPIRERGGIEIIDEGFARAGRGLKTTRVKTVMQKFSRSRV